MKNRTILQAITGTGAMCALFALSVAPAAASSHTKIVNHGQDTKVAVHNILNNFCIKSSKIVIDRETGRANNGHDDDCDGYTDEDRRAIGSYIKFDTLDGQMFCISTPSGFTCPGIALPMTRGTVKFFNDSK